MPQTSGPLTDQTFTDAQWREANGDEAGITQDLNGTSYTLVLSTSSDVATVGSTSQTSRARVGGFVHRIDQGQTEGITVPAASSATRTDLIGLQYDPAWGAAEPGPVRLHRVPGTEGAGVPTYDGSQPGVEFMPLWSVTRNPGQALSQATTKDLRVRTGPTLFILNSDLTSLPVSAPIGTRVRLGQGPNARDLIRALDDQGTPVWESFAQRTYSRVYAIQVPATGSTPITWPAMSTTSGVVHASLKYQGLIGDVAVTALPWKITPTGCEVVLIDKDGTVKTSGLYDVMVTVASGV